MIGGEILVTVMEVSGNTVRLGIAAPEGISIYREEIWLAVEEENRAAAAAGADALPSGPPGEALSAVESANASPPDSSGNIPNARTDTDGLPSEPLGETPSDQL